MNFDTIRTAVLNHNMEWARGASDTERVELLNALLDGVATRKVIVTATPIRYKVTVNDGIVDSNGGFWEAGMPLVDRVERTADHNFDEGRITGMYRHSKPDGFDFKISFKYD